MSDDKDIMYRAYHANPELLGLELRVLFEPCTDATFAVLHNKAIDIIQQMCGEVVEEKDDVGSTVRSEFQLTCKNKLAGHLARSVLMYARQK